MPMLNTGTTPRCHKRLITLERKMDCYGPYKPLDRTPGGYTGGRIAFNIISPGVWLCLGALHNSGHLTRCLTSTITLLPRKPPQDVGSGWFCEPPKLSPTGRSSAMPTVATIDSSELDRDHHSGPWMWSSHRILTFSWIHSLLSEAGIENDSCYTSLPLIAFALDLWHFSIRSMLWAGELSIICCPEISLGQLFGITLLKSCRSLQQPLDSTCL